MNIFPLDVQYLISDLFLKINEKTFKKEIILLYTYPEYSNVIIKGCYYPEKIVEKKLRLDEYLFINSVYFGNIQLMKWLLEKGCPWNCNTFACGARHGNLDNMKWLRENACPWDYYTFQCILKNGNLENIKWFKKNVYSLRSET